MFDAGDVAEDDLTDETEIASAPPSAVYVLYSQVASILGAFTFIMFTSHIVDWNWKGILIDLVGGWTDVIRPATKYLLDRTIGDLFHYLFGFELAIPLPVKDYLSVGIMLGLSSARSMRLYSDDWDHTNSTANFLIMYLFLPPALIGWWIVFWPLAFPVLMCSLLYNVVTLNFPKDFKMYALAVAPGIYFGLVFAANKFLL